MKNLMIYLLLGIGLSGITVQAEEASVPEFAAIFQLSTSDQASVAAAFVAVHGAWPAAAARLAAHRAPCRRAAPRTAAA